MFTKKPEKDGPVIDAGKPGLNPLRPGGPPQMSNARPSARGGSGTPSVIGPDLSITGNLESKGEIQIEGEVQGGGPFRVCAVAMNDHARPRMAKARGVGRV